MKFLLKAAFDTSSGYGGDGVGIARSLAARGYDVKLWPVSVTPPIPREVAMLLTEEIEPIYDVAISHESPPVIETTSAVRNLSDRTIAWTMWEWSLFKHPARRTLRRRLEQFDVLLSYDEVTRDALAPFVPDSVDHRVLQGGFWSEDWPFVADRDWGGTFRFVMVGQLHQRKDPFAAIEAFVRLKREHGDAFDAELHLKTNVVGLSPHMEEAYDGVHIHDKWWSTDRLKKLYASSHCYLAPSKGEGKNLPALEAQATGIPVIATNVGGHLGWLSSEYGYVCPWTPEQTEWGQWALADRGALTELMWHVYQNRDEARRKGEIAARTIPAMCDWTKVIGRLMDVVNQTPRRELGLDLSAATL